jgi:hypothetical protein
MLFDPSAFSVGNQGLVFCQGHKINLVMDIEEVTS